MTAPADRIPLLLGHFGGHNAGDEAILDGTCHLLAAAGVVAARVVTRRADYRPVLTAPMRVEPVVASVPAMYRALRGSSMVVLCGGTHFNDDFPGARRLRHYRYLALHLLVIVAARATGRRVAAIGQGIGPLVHPVGRFLTRVFIALVPAGTVRDDASWVRAQRLGARAPRWRRTFDTAAVAAHRLRTADDPRTAIAIAPVHLAGPALWDACTNVLAADWTTWGLERIDVLAFRGGDREGDQAIARSLASRMRNVAPVQLTVFSGDVDQLVDTLGTARIALCGRYHALVLSLLAGAVPVVLPAHPKLVDTAELLRIPDNLIVRTPTADAVGAALRAAIDFDARKLRPLLDDLRELLEHDRALLARTGERS